MKFLCRKKHKLGKAIILMSGLQYSRANLRNLIMAMEAYAGKFYHLGIVKTVTRSNLNKANALQDYRILENFPFYSHYLNL